MFEDRADAVPWDRHERAAGASAAMGWRPALSQSLCSECPSAGQVRMAPGARPLFAVARSHRRPVIAGVAVRVETCEAPRDPAPASRRGTQPVRPAPRPCAADSERLTVSNRHGPGRERRSVQGGGTLARHARPARRRRRKSRGPRPAKPARRRSRPAGDRCPDPGGENAGCRTICRTKARSQPAAPKQAGRRIAAAQRAHAGRAVPRRAPRGRPAQGSLQRGRRGGAPPLQ